MTWLDDARKSHVCQLRHPLIPPLFHDAVIGGIKTQSFRDIATIFVRDFWQLAEAGKAPAFFGRVGTYKSYAAAAIAHLVRKSALIDVEFVQCGPLFLELENFRFEAHTRERIDWLSAAPLVVFDDFTKLRPGSWGVDMLDAIVEKRYGRKRPTLYTGNAVITATDWKQISDHFGAGFTRRLQEGAAGLTAVAK